MNIFFSGDVHRKKDFFDRRLVGNFLISLACENKLHKKMNEKFSHTFDQDLNLMIDNGAFSAWNSGKKIITIDDYTEFCLKFNKEYSSRFKNIYYIGLDCIPGKVNHSPSKEEINDAVKITYSNYEHMMSKGCKNVLPVFHQHEDIEWGLRYQDHTDYICVSPANDESNSGRQKWLDVVYKELNIKTRTHGLAVTGQVLLEKYPWYSVDATTWKNPAIFGEYLSYKLNNYFRFKCSDIRDPRKDIKKASLNDCLFLSRYLDHNTDNLHKNLILSLQNFNKYEKYLTELWTERNIIWED